MKAYAWSGRAKGKTGKNRSVKVGKGGKTRGGLDKLIVEQHGGESVWS